MALRKPVFLCHHSTRSSAHLRPHGVFPMAPSTPIYSLANTRNHNHENHHFQLHSSLNMDHHNSPSPPQPPAVVSASSSTLLNQHFSQPMLNQHSIIPAQNQSYFYCCQNQLPGFSSPFFGTNTAGKMLQEQERMSVRAGQLDPYTSKAARICRRMARQRRLCLNRNHAAAQPEARRLSLSASASVDDAMRYLFKFITPDNKRLRVLLKKVLKNSDVGALGRIVLPKKAAEGNLPCLVDKEGIQMVVREVISSDQTWTFKYKFWSNNNSRMYVLENTGEFVRQKELGMGDSLTLYEDESKNLYVSVTKAAESAASGTSINALNPSHHHEQSSEEEASLALLIDQVFASHDGEAAEPDDANDDAIYPVPNDGASSSRASQGSPRRGVAFTEDGCSWSSAAAVEAITAGGKERMVEDHRLITFDDCYGGLDTLPDISRYNFSP